MYLLEDDIKTFQTKDKNKNGQYEVRIPVFDIYHKIIGNGNGSERITISVYEIRCHPKDSIILKVLLAKCSEDPEKKFAFVPFNLTQMTSNSIYRRQIIIHNNFITPTVVIPEHGITKKAMKKRLYNKLIKLSEVYGIEKQTT